MEHLNPMMAENGTRPTPFVSASETHAMRAVSPPSPINPEPAIAAADGESTVMVEPAADPASTNERRRGEMTAPAPCEDAVGGRGPVVTRLMNALARGAWEAETEAEALSMVGALVPLAIQQAVQDGTTLWTAAPGMLRAAAEVTESLYRFPAYQPLLTLLPRVLAQAVERLGHAAAEGRRISPRLGYLVVTRAAATAITKAEAGWLEDALWEAISPPASEERMYQVFVE